MRFRPSLSATLSVTKNAKSLSLAAAILFAGACGQQSSIDSSLDVNNGEDITESNHPSVVLLIMSTGGGQGICTGTFVNDSQVVTAGHCVHGLDPKYPAMAAVAVSEGSDGNPEYKVRARALNLVQHPKYSMTLDNGVNGFDLAVVNFPANSAPAVSTIASQEPELEADLTIVGYGNNRTYIDAAGRLNGDGAGTKRMGTNSVAAKEEGFLTFYGLPKAESPYQKGEWVTAGSGDSGGPMFVDGELVGVTSGGGLAETDEGKLVGVSNYVNLNSPSSRKFLQANLN